MFVFCSLLAFRKSTILRDACLIHSPYGGVFAQNETNETLQSIFIRVLFTDLKCQQMPKIMQVDWIQFGQSEQSETQIGRVSFIGHGQKFCVIIVW
jgi:hypothetical protein